MANRMWGMVIYLLCRSDVTPATARSDYLEGNGSDPLAGIVGAKTLVPLELLLKVPTHCSFPCARISGNQDHRFHAASLREYKILADSRKEIFLDDTACFFVVSFKPHVLNEKFELSFGFAKAFTSWISFFNPAFDF